MYMGIDIGTSAVKAVVVLNEGAVASANELIQSCNGRIAGYKIPKAFHWIDAMPTGPTGKLFRRALRVDG